MTDRIVHWNELTADQRRLIQALIDAAANDRPRSRKEVSPVGIRHETLVVTPELAAEWLAKPSARQRSVARNTVAKYSRAMTEGRWHEPTTDPIAFTEDGLLLNGQHRLTAVVKSGVSLEMLVAYDVPAILFDVIDTGRARTASQFVGQPYANELAATARLLLWYDERRLADPTKVAQPTGSGAMSFDNDEILAVIEGEASATLAEAVREGKNAYRWCGIPTSVHAAVLVIARREGADSGRLDGWLYGITEGIGLELDDPRRRLRQRLTDHNSKHLRRSIPAVWMLTVRAFNAYMQGRPVKTLKYEADDAPPAIDLTGKVGGRERVAAHRAVTTHASGVTSMAASSGRS